MRPGVDADGRAEGGTGEFVGGREAPTASIELAISIGDAGADASGDGVGGAAAGKTAGCGDAGSPLSPAGPREKNT